MKSLLNNFCKYTVAMAVLVILCAQTTWAGNRSKHNKSSNVIAAPNGNTGFAGTGLSQSGSKWQNHMQKTEIYGTDQPETWITPTGTSSLEDFILWKIKNKSSQKKSGDVKQGPTQADLDAQVLADKVYVAAQNEASISRGNLGGWQGKFNLADAQATAAYQAWEANKTPQTREAYEAAKVIRDQAAYNVGVLSRVHNERLAAVAAATVKKNEADAKVAAATPSKGKKH